MKVMTNLRHNLWLGHFVGRFHHNRTRFDFVFLELFFQFALGLSGTKYYDGSCITKIGNDLVVVVREVTLVCSLARIISRNVLGFKRTIGRLA